MRRLIAIFAIVAAAGCSSAPPKTTSAPTSAPTRTGRGTTPPPLNASAAADEVVTRANTERRSKGLTTLTKSVNLMRAAQIHADQMASVNQLEHDLPGAKYPTLSSRLAAVSYILGAAGENIGEGYRNAAEATTGWMGSSGHRANILSTKYTEIGSGVATAKNGTRYWVQVFGKPR